MKNSLKNKMDEFYLKDAVQDTEESIKSNGFNIGLLSGFAGVFAATGVNGLLNGDYVGGAGVLGIGALNAGCAVYAGKKISQGIKRLKGLSEKVGELRAASSELTNE